MDASSTLTGPWRKATRWRRHRRAVASAEGRRRARVGCMIDPKILRTDYAHEEAIAQKDSGGDSESEEKSADCLGEEDERPRSEVGWEGDWTKEFLRH